MICTGANTASKPDADRSVAQEARLARPAEEGLTSPEIAAALYLSPPTVEWHFGKIFTKHWVSTRRQLRRSRSVGSP